MAKFLCICLSSTIQRTVVFSHFHPENVNRSEKYRMDAAGKAVNSARVLNQLENGSVVVVCPVGEENSEQFMKLAEQDNLSIVEIKTPGRTRECWTIVDKAEHKTTELVVSEPLNEFDYSEAEYSLLTSIKEEVLKCDVVLLAGSCPGYWSKSLPALIAKIAKDNNKFFMADYYDESLISTLGICTPDIIKINEEEYKRTFKLGNYITTDDLRISITNKSKELKSVIIVTRGTDDTFAADNGVFISFPSEKVVPVNTTACGDSFSAGFLYEYMKGSSLQDSIAKAVWCAARNAESEVPGSILNY